jgi:hypothetical protein
MLTFNENIETSNYTSSNTIFEKFGVESLLNRIPYDSGSAAEVVAKFNVSKGKEKLKVVRNH